MSGASSRVAPKNGTTSVGHETVTRYVSRAMVTRTVREDLVTRSVSEGEPGLLAVPDERWGVYRSSLVDTSGYQ